MTHARLNEPCVAAQMRIAVLVFTLLSVTHCVRHGHAQQPQAASRASRGPAFAQQCSSTP